MTRWLSRHSGCVAITFRLIQTRDLLIDLYLLAFAREFFLENNNPKSFLK